MTEEGEFAHEDVIAFCPRIDKEILVIGGCCFYRERPRSCWGCVFNRDFVTVKLTILLKEMLEAKP